MPARWARRRLRSGGRWQCRFRWSRCLLGAWRIGWSGWVGVLDGFFERSQRPLPERLEVRAQQLESGRLEAVDVAGADALLLDQAGLAQDLEVLGHRRAAHRQLVGQPADGARAVGHELEN